MTVVPKIVLGLNIPTLGEVIRVEEELVSSDIATRYKSNKQSEDNQDSARRLLEDNQKTENNRLRIKESRSDYIIPDLTTEESLQVVECREGNRGPQRCF